MSREAMTQALEALEETLRTLDDENAKPGGAIADTIWYSEHETLFDFLASKITALQEALAEPQEKYIYGTPLLDAMTGKQPAQPSKPWVGLTDEEVKHQWEIWRANIPRYVGFAKGIEAKLREKNT